MRIAMVACMQPQSSRPSGIATYVENVLLRLARRNIEATLVGCGDDDGLDVPYSFISLSKDTRITSTGFLARLMSRASSLDIQSDAIVHTHRPDDAIPFLLFRRSNPKVLTLHGSHARNIHQNRGQLIGSAYRMAESYSLRRNNRVVSVSEANEEFYLGRYPWLREKLIVVPQGVDPNVFKPLDRRKARRAFGLGEKDLIILFAGRFEKEKSIDLLIESFGELRGRHRQAKLLLVGEGRDEAYLKSLVSQKGLQDVTFAPPVGRLRMPWLLNCADVFALLSTHEGLPLTVLEALSCGVPVVATRVGDIPRIVRDGKTGSLVGERDPVEIAGILREVGRNRAAYSEACRKIGLESSWDGVVDRMIAIYEDVQDGKITQK